MKDVLTEQIDKLYEEPCFLELLKNMRLSGYDVHALAEAYIYQESPFEKLETEE